VRVHHALALAGATFLITFGGFGLLGRTLFARVWPSYAVLTGIGLPALALLMETIVERRVLAQERERFRAVLDNATDAIRILDADTHAILDCNRADCELSGLPREQMLGRDSRPFWPSSSAAAMRDDSGGERGPVLARTQSAMFRAAAGRVLSVDCARRVVEYRHRRYEIVIFRDAAERLAGEDARREAAALRSVNLLAQAAAHEINNPLAIITGYVQMLEERLPPGTEESHWAHNCRNAAARIRDAVGRLSRIVRVEATQPTGTLPSILDTKRSTEKLRDDAGR
jgi:PAS domain S-box-containing protein